MKIDLPISGSNGAIIAIVLAEIVDVAPHVPESTFAVHKQESYAPWAWNKWTVSNIETGHGGNEFSGRTRAQAIENARNFLVTKTRNKIIFAMNKSNRFIRER